MNPPPRVALGIFPIPLDAFINSCQEFGWSYSVDSWRMFVTQIRPAFPGRLPAGQYRIVHIKQYGFWDREGLVKHTLPNWCPFINS
jgi:hypothetical protein